MFSKVKDAKHAIFYRNDYGPCFDDDIEIFSSDETTDYNTIFSKKKCYEKRIRDTADKFSMEDYEVFQIIRNKTII